MKYLTDETIVWAYRLFLGRDPLGKSEVERHRCHESINSLRQYFLTCPECMFRWKNIQFPNVCAALLHWSHRTFPHENVNSEENYQQRYLEEPGIVDLLLERNQEDFKLYNYVKQNIVVNTISPEFNLAPIYPVQDEESIRI